MSMNQVRQVAEVAVPGAVIGVLAGAFVGGMGALVGLPIGWALTGSVTLGVPLALLGGGYGVFVGLGRIRPGVFTPAAVLWLLGFPLARLLHETMTPVLLGGSPAPPDNIATFLAFQALISPGFAIGFVWMFERLTPPWLLSIKDRNPIAEEAYSRYAVHAAVLWEARERKRARRAGRPANRAPATAGAAARGRHPRSS
ncbi:hypothetical protein [Pseudonocardia sp. DLS-67]